MEKIGDRKCCFIGHRTVKNIEETIDRLYKQVQRLIEENNVRIFLFGSRSEFNDICHSVVTDIKSKYRDIRRIMYCCRSESACMESERASTNAFFSRMFDKRIELLGFEEERRYPSYLTAGRASYVERNKAMINDSNYCIFYYCDEYAPSGGGNSGTRIAYRYAQALAKRKDSKLEIINVFH